MMITAQPTVRFPDPDSYKEKNGLTPVSPDRNLESRGPVHQIGVITHDHEDVRGSVSKMTEAKKVLRFFKKHMPVDGDRPPKIVYHPGRHDEPRQKTRAQSVADTFGWPHDYFRNHKDVPEDAIAVVSIDGRRSDQVTECFSSKVDGAPRIGAPDAAAWVVQLLPEMEQTRVIVYQPSGEHEVFVRNW